MVGFFDSGVGGLSILQEVERLLPNLSTVYFSDSENFPYGTKNEDEVRILSLKAVDVLMKYRPAAIVVACNTASTSALTAIREHVSDIPVIGVVPALKPAVEQTKTKTVAVLATARTLVSDAYRELQRTFAAGITVIDQPCPGWVELVESGHADDAEADRAVREIVEPLVEKNIDAYVLGCTHYPFLRKLIERYAGAQAAVLDSGEAVAKQLLRVLPKKKEPQDPRREIFITSGEKNAFQKLASELLGRKITVE